MPDITVFSRPGQQLNTGDARANFLKMFGGEVLASYENATLFDGKVRTKTIDSGKSWQFPLYGRTNALYHTPGVELVGQTDRIPFQERLISIDGQLIAHTWVNNVDELLTHFDVRGPITSEIGRALARAYDRRCYQSIIRAARTGSWARTLTGTASANIKANGSSGAVSVAASTTTITDPYFGTRNASLQSATARTSAASLLGCLTAAAQIMDEKNVTGERYAPLNPAQYYLLLNSGSATAGPMVVNKDWGGAGNVADGVVMKYMGINLMKSNNMHQEDILAAAEGAAITGGESYAGDFTQTVCPVFATDAVATVQRLGITSEMEYQVDKQSTLLLAKFMRGTGVYRPEHACEIAVGDISSAAKILPA